MNIDQIVEQLKSERDRLDQAIQALEGQSGPKKRGRKPGMSKTSAEPGKRRRGRPPLTPAQKKALSEQMKKRWAERKAAARKS